MEEAMLKKAALAVFGLVLAVTVMAPPKAAAQVHIGVQIGAPVVVQPAPVVVYDEPYFVAHHWNSGYHDGYYYDHGTRYRMDHGHRRYDDRYRDGRREWEHHDHGHHDGGHDDHGHGDR
jgi:hypothetical protein